ncbi:MAG: excinuclease ABC subunit C [Candidatus Binatia bacterium]|jgi:excinuclease ABC subunit C
MPASEKIRKKVGDLPHKPGVYLMKDRFGTVIYVGKARDLRKRVSQYFHPSRRHGWDLKLAALIEAIHDFDTHIVKSDAESVLLEGRLIKDFRPRYNVSFRDDKRFLLLKINLNDAVPRFTLTRIRQDDGAKYFGPFASSGALRRTLTMVRRKFNLRGCRPLNPTEHDYKHCLHAHLKDCTAPCIANVTREQYLLQVNAACDFMGGQCSDMKEELETAMKKAAERLDFEKAAELRDLIDDLKRTTKKTSKFPRMPYTLPVALDPDKDLIELGKALKLECPPERIEGYDISNISGTLAVSSMVSFKNGRPDRANYRRFRIKTVVGQDDFACMAETIYRRYRRLLQDIEKKKKDEAEADSQYLLHGVEPPEEADKPEAELKLGLKTKSPKPSKSTAKLPDLILIDGGKGQLNAACAQLARLGLQNIPTIGLAKEFEEIYFPGKSSPLRLGLDSNALKMLQRVRDESHRFANTYNAQLRIKKISESLLDEFPGIGDNRKLALLKKFGSVQRLRLATLEQLCEVEGFGQKSAAALKRFLEARQAE